MEKRPGARGHQFIFAEISNRGPLPNDGMQERSVFDGRWKLVYREKAKTAWRQVNTDLKDAKPWGNRSYAETVRVKEQFPEAYRILTEMDPQSRGGNVPCLELYDLQTDPDEMLNLAVGSVARPHRDRLYAALRQWVRATADPAVAPLASQPLRHAPSDQEKISMISLAECPKGPVSGHPGPNVLTPIFPSRKPDLMYTGFNVGGGDSGTLR